MQVIVLLSECLHKILEVGLLERLKTLSMVVIVLWKCRECCQRVDDAVKKYETQHLQEVPSEQRQKTLTPQMLLKVAMQPGFKESITMAEQGFTEVRRMRLVGPRWQAVVLLRRLGSCVSRFRCDSYDKLLASATVTAGTDEA